MGIETPLRELSGHPQLGYRMPILRRGKDMHWQEGGGLYRADREDWIGNATPADSR